MIGKRPESNKVIRALLQWLKLPERGVVIRWSGCFFTFISLFSIAIGFRYLLAYSIPKEPLGLFYTFAAFFSHFALPGFISWMLLIIPIAALLPERRLIIVTSIVLASLLLSMVLLDSLVFAENRFHFSSLTVRILGWKTWGFGIVYGFIFIVFTSVLAKWIWQRYITQRKRIYGLIIAFTTVILLLCTHALHAWADANYYTPITRFTTYLPFFYPTTAKRFLIKHGLATIGRKEQLLVRNLQENNSAGLRYPLKPLQFKPSNEMKNVLFIVIDALRADALNGELSPNSMHFSASAIVCKDHYSAGNSTRMGIFSLFYGLPSTYWQYFVSLNRAPVLMDAFMTNNYKLGIFSSEPLYAPANLECTVFAQVQNLRMKTDLPGNNHAFAKDSAITAEWVAWLDGLKPDDLFFGFLFYDAVCERSYPPAYEPLLQQMHADSKMQERFNRYTVALRYVDSLVGVVLGDLKRRDLLDKSIVIITADHGEGFNEENLGYKGHGSAYNDYQLKVPLIIHWPDKPPAVIDRRTSHNDIAATLMEELFGCLNPSSDYCSGRSLFSVSQWKWLIVGSYYNFAILEPQQITVQYPGGYFEIRDRNYQVIAKPDIHKSVLTEAFNEVGRFLKNR